MYLRELEDLFKRLEQHYETTSEIVGQEGDEYHYEIFIEQRNTVRQINAFLGTCTNTQIVFPIVLNQLVQKYPKLNIEYLKDFLGVELEQQKEAIKKCEEEKEKTVSLLTQIQSNAGYLANRF